MLKILVVAMLMVCAMLHLGHAQSPQQMEYERQQRELRLQMERQQEQQRQQQKQMEENARRQQEEMRRLNTPPASPSYSTPTPTPSYGATQQQRPGTQQQSSSRSVAAAAPASPPPPWKKVMSSDNVDFYADPTSIKRVGSFARMTDIRDYRTRHEVLGGRPVSFKAVSEYDCVGKRSRQLSFSSYSDHVGRGSVVNSTAVAPPSWSSADVDWQSALLKMACERR